MDAADPSRELSRLRCWAEIDLAALEANFRKIRASLPDGIRLISVVKADAYGHGLSEAAAALARARPDLFAVANAAEAAVLRRAVPDAPVLLLSPVLPAEDGLLAEANLIPVVSGEDEAARFEAAGRAAGRPLPVHLKIDTGMGRAGVWHEDAAALHGRIARLPHLRLDGIFTHFASSDDDPAFTAEQRRRFLAALAACAVDPRRLLVHADNSAGIESFPRGGPFNAVRIGLLQYGVLPRPASASPRLRPEPVFSLRTRVGLVKPLPRGATVSYGRTRALERDSRIAVLCAGYGDGIPRSASNRAEVLIGGRRCPVVGRVTMDMVLADVTDLPGVAAGDEAVFFGRQGPAEISVGEFSAWCGTIPWESLCAVTKRVPRIYRRPS